MASRLLIVELWSILLAALVWAGTVHAQPCEPRWSDQFGTGDVGWDGNIDGIRDFVIYDDGTEDGGPALYAAGHFLDAGGAPARAVARWDGRRWRAVGEPWHTFHSALAAADALAVYDDGSGEALYVGGAFNPPGIPPNDDIAFPLARFRNGVWEPLPIPDTDFVWARDLLVVREGGSDVLYVAGEFALPDGFRKLMRFDASGWTPIGPPESESFPGVGRALAYYDDGSGPKLYLAGWFTQVGGVPAANVARWDGQHWEALGSGLPNGCEGAFVFGPGAHDLLVHDDGSGLKLYAAGSFRLAGGTYAVAARWGGNAWNAVGGKPTCHWNDIFTSLALYDDGSGSGPTLYAGGKLYEHWTIEWASLYRWDGQRWVGQGERIGGDTSVWTLIAHDDGSGPSLFAGGRFLRRVGQTNRNVARWHGATWRPLLQDGIDGTVDVMAVHDDGSGPRLYAGGRITGADDRPARGLAAFDGVHWSIPTPDLSYVRCLLSYDDGTGPALYVSGVYDGDWMTGRLGPGSVWEVLTPRGSAISGPMAIFDDGTGPKLYVGNGYLFRWDNPGWTKIEGNFGEITALRVFDDGSGPALFVAGLSTESGPLAGMNNIAKWDGRHWYELDGGVGQAPGEMLTPYVHALEIYDDGSGPALYAAGAFGTAGGLPASRIAKWNGQSWSPAGDGMNGAMPIRALEVYDDGSGPALYAAGEFETNYGAPGDYLARWDGQGWSAPGTLRGPSITSGFALVTYGDSLYVGGNFTGAGNESSGSIARLIGCDRCGPDCDGDGTLTLRDFVCFRNQFTGGDMQADFDGSGAIDLNDFVAFRNAYAAGCP